jgi:transposase
MLHLQAVASDQQLVLSYGDRSSDDFFMHYGFVPSLCNPHEVRSLFL